MDSTPTDYRPSRKMTLALMPTPAKALATCIIAVLAIGMMGALGQIVVHDIIPAFFWLHVSGGGMFVAVFAYVPLRALWEMWLKAMPAARRQS